MKYILLIVILFLVACTNPKIVKLSPDTYMLYREDHAGIFGSPSSLKAGVIRDANTFAENQGKIAIPITSNSKPLDNGPAQWASFEYQFRVVDKKDPEAKRTSLLPRADIVIDQKTNISAEIDSKVDVEPDDIYAQLIKLDDLRNKGILTDEEFENEKTKILNSN